MDPFTLFVYSLGVGLSLMDANKRQRMSRQSRDVERAGVDANIELINANAQQESLDAMIALRQSMGAVLAINAARGAGGGSGYSLIGSSERAFNRDEKTRDLNTKTQIASARARGLMSEMHNVNTQNQISSNFAQTILGMLPVSSLVQPKQQNIANVTTSSATSAATRAARRAAFGLESVGY